MKNIKQFKVLAERYLSITLEEIEKAFEYPLDKDSVKIALTGFGSFYSCSLCIAANYNRFNLCKYCTWETISPKNSDAPYNFACQADSTYSSIEQAHNAKDLYDAYQKRGKYMLDEIKKLGS